MLDEQIWAFLISPGAVRRVAGAAHDADIEECLQHIFNWHVQHPGQNSWDSRLTICQPTDVVAVSVLHLWIMMCRLRSLKPHIVLLPEEVVGGFVGYEPIIYRVYSGYAPEMLIDIIHNPDRVALAQYCETKSETLLPHMDSSFWNAYGQAINRWSENIMSPGQYIRLARFMYLHPEITGMSHVSERLISVPYSQATIETAGEGRLQVLRWARAPFVSNLLLDGGLIYTSGNRIPGLLIVFNTT